MAFGRRRKWVRLPSFVLKFYGRVHRPPFISSPITFGSVGYFSIKGSLMEQVLIGASGLTPVEKVMVKSDYMLYTRWRFLHTNDFKFAMNWHFQVIANKLEDLITTISTRDTVINIYPGAAKSEMVSIGLTAFTMGLHSSNKVIVTSYSLSPVAENFTAQAKDILTSEWHQDVFPVEMSRSTGGKKHFKTEGGGEVIAAGTGGAVTGFRGGTGRTVNGERPYTGCLITDDPLKAGDSRSALKLAEATLFQSETLKSRKFHPKNPRILVMQRLSEVDPSGWALENNWDHLKIPAILTKKQLIYFCNKAGIDYKTTGSWLNGDHEADEYACWHWKMALEDHREDRGDVKGTAGIGSFVFSGQYQQDPNPEGGGMIKTKSFQRYSEIPDNIQFKIVTADTAWDEGTRNDFSVLQCWGFTKQGIYLLDQWRDKVDFDKLKKIAIAFNKKHRPKHFYVEKAQSGIGLIQALKKQHGCPVVAIIPSKCKVTRAQDAQPSIEAGLVFIPDEMSCTWVNGLTGETEKFPVGKNDDQVDCLVMAVVQLCINQIFTVPTELELVTVQDLEREERASGFSMDAFEMLPTKPITDNPWIDLCGL